MLIIPLLSVTAVSCDKDKDEPVNEPVTNTINGHEYVDLGLPSGLKWATCNVGASTPKDYGDYFAWGETSPKSEYTESNSLTHGKSLTELTEAGIINSERILTPSHDAASVNWGGTWRMPTKEEWEELSQNCEWRCTSNITTVGDNITVIIGTPGYEITGPSGNTIFLPAVGWYGTSHQLLDGVSGRYYSSSVDEDEENDGGYFILFDDWLRYVGKGTCYHGFSIRPVSE